MVDLNLQVLKDAALLYLPKVTLALLVIIVGFWLSSRLASLFKRALVKRSVDVTVVPILRSLVSVVLKVLVLLSAASMFGIEVTSFVAIFSAIALAIGLALQGNLSHFASGLLLLTLRPYQVGDVVTIGGQTGTVEGIHMFNTILIAPDNRKHVVPNGKITSETITNLSGQGTRGVDINIGIGYNDDIDKARAVMLEVINAYGPVLAEPVPTVLVTALNDSSVNLFSRPHVNSADFWLAKCHFNEQIKKAFDREGITIPFPQREVWVRGENKVGIEV
ncbi:MAG: mechanosensitive ion channel family protein [Saprospiraceae bacterium]